MLKRALDWALQPMLERIDALRGDIALLYRTDADRTHRGTVAVEFSRKFRRKFSRLV